MSVWVVIALAVVLLAAVRAVARWVYRVVWLGDQRATDPESLVAVGAPNSKLEAGIIADALRSEGVPVFVRELVSAEFGFSSESYFGHWEVRVRDADYERAKAVLDRNDARR